MTVSHPVPIIPTSIYGIVLHRLIEHWENPVNDILY